MLSMERSLLATGEEFEGHGFRQNKHGFDYQVSQFIHLALRASKIDHQPFQLASDIRAGDKWDDIVYKKAKVEAKGSLYWLVQVKHVHNRDKKISLANLLSAECTKTNNSFSLSKYFKSFLRIKRNESPDTLLGPNDSIEGLCILTNTDFAYGEKCGDFIMEENIFEKIEKELLFSNRAIRFKEEFKGKKELVFCLRRGVVDMPFKFSRSVKDGKCFVYKIRNLNSGLNELQAEYERALITEVISQQKNAFSENFIQDNGLSRAARHFREEIYSMCIETDKCTNEESFRKYLMILSFRWPNIEGGSLRKGSAAIHSNTNGAIRSSTPKTAEELDSDIEEFLRRLAFVLNHPDDQETIQFSIKELAAWFEFEDQASIKSAYYWLRTEVDSWMSNISANFLTRADFERFFKDCRGYFAEMRSMKRSHSLLLSYVKRWMSDKSALTRADLEKFLKDFREYLAVENLISTPMHSCIAMSSLAPDLNGRFI